MECPNVCGGKDKVSRVANLDNRIDVSVVGSREVTEMYCAYSFIIIPYSADNADELQ